MISTEQRSITLREGQHRLSTHPIVPTYVPAAWTLPVMEGPTCTVCGGSGKVAGTGGGEVTCPNCGGSGEERGDPRDVLIA